MTYVFYLFLDLFALAKHPRRLILVLLNRDNREWFDKLDKSAQVLTRFLHQLNIVATYLSFSNDKEFLVFQKPLDCARSGQMGVK